VETLKEIRIKHYWEALDQENDAIELEKLNRRAPYEAGYQPKNLANGDTAKQPLARVKYGFTKGFKFPKTTDSVEL
jgi:transposase